MRVTEAAVKTPDGKVWFVPRPGRHDAVFARIFSEGNYDRPLNETQGFVDEEGNFLTRTEAEVMARASGQMSGPIIGGELTSEDLWDSWRCGYDVNEREVIGGCGNIYERPRRPRGRAYHRRHSRINPARTTTCPSCGQVDALYGRPKARTWTCGQSPSKSVETTGCGLKYERPPKPKRQRLLRVNPKRTTTCPSCGHKDALYARPKADPAQ